MESTDIYWQPVYAILEGACELIVGNAQHIKHMPGRKTDVKDSESIRRMREQQELPPGAPVFIAVAVLFSPSFSSLNVKVEGRPAYGSSPQELS